MNSIKNPRPFIQKFLSPIEKFIRLEASGGLFLLFSTFIALLWANSPWAHLYFEFLHLPIKFQFGTLILDKSLQHWVNDGLMVIFFLVVGLEIKRELLIGELSHRKKAILPLFAALGGMIFPALIYIFFNYREESAIRGWAIPMATDIAFAVGILSLMSHRVPFPLKIFLLALAIVDDLGAVLVIAFFYTDHISKEALTAVVFTLALIQLIKFFQVRKFTIYIFLGALNWLAFLKSGIHATISGVILGLMTPVDTIGKEKKSPLDQLTHILHPLVTFFIMPIFALTNAGISFKEVHFFKTLSHPIFYGIFLGLVVGKPLGVFLFSLFSVKMNLAVLPKNVNFFHILCVGMLSGIGFTMSIFISLLAFKTHGEYISFSKISILLASIVAGLVGSGLLHLNTRS